MSEAQAAEFLAFLRGQFPESALPSSTEITTPLTARLAEAKAAWPDLAIQESTFLAYLAAHVQSAETAAAYLEEVHAADLLLACGCAQQLPAALAAFETQALRMVPTFVGHLDRSPAFLDEVTQTLRTKLLIAEGDAPARITAYSGRGPLSSWLRVTAVRTALNLRRGKDDKPMARIDEAAERMAQPGHDPEMDVIKARYREAFQTAVRAAFLALSHEQRTVLHLHLVGGLTTTRIGTLFKVNHSTVSRWIAGAREAVFNETKRLLSTNLKLRPGEFDSLVRLLHSQLDLSLTGLLQSLPPPPPPSSEES